MGNLQDAFDSVVAACNDAHIGYSQPKRTTIKLGQTYDTYCDCSSLMSWALTRGGYFKTNPWFSTSNERSKLQAAGWTQVSISGVWQPGDIVWRSGHTEMVYQGKAGSGITMGAHSPNRAWAEQVSIGNYYRKDFTELWRDTGAPPVGNVSWYQDEHDYLPQEQRDSNAYLVYAYLASEGFQAAAIAGILGNMAAESGVNPAAWQSYGNINLGYGLVQWTPASNYINWASSNNVDRTDPDENGQGEMDYLISTWNSHWITTAQYPYDMDEYKAIEDDWEEACRAFYAEYERGSTPNWPVRLAAAERYYNMIKDGDFPGDPGGGGDINGIPYGGIINDLHFRKILPGYI